MFFIYITVGLALNYCLVSVARTLPVTQFLDSTAFFVNGRVDPELIAASTV